MTSKWERQLSHSCLHLTSISEHQLWPPPAVLELFDLRIPLFSPKIVQNHKELLFTLVLSTDIDHIKTKIDHFRSIYSLIPFLKK